jgi:hypothetical protein
MPAQMPGVYDADSVTAIVSERHNNPSMAAELRIYLKAVENAGFVFAVMDPEGFIPTKYPDDDYYRE